MLGISRIRLYRARYGGGSNSIPARRKNGTTSHRKRLGDSPASIRLRQRAEQPARFGRRRGGEADGYQVIRPTTLLEILAGAGGIADDAGSVVIVTRSSTLRGQKRCSRDRRQREWKRSAAHCFRGRPTRTKSANHHDSFTEPAGIRRFVLQHSVYGGDVVSVPRAGIVYVMARGIAQPGGYVLQSHGSRLPSSKQWRWRTE